MGSTRLMTGVALLAMGFLFAMFVAAAVIAAPHLGPVPWGSLLGLPFIWLVLRGLCGRPGWVAGLCAAIGILLLVALFGRSMLYVYLVTFEGVVTHFRVDDVLNALGLALASAPFLVWVDRVWKSGHDAKRATHAIPSATRVDRPTPSP